MSNFSDFFPKAASGGGGGSGLQISRDFTTTGTFNPLDPAGDGSQSALTDGHIISFFLIAGGRGGGAYTNGSTASNRVMNGGSGGNLYLGTTLITDTTQTITITVGAGGAGGVRTRQNSGNGNTGGTTGGNSSITGAGVIDKSTADSNFGVFNTSTQDSWVVSSSDPSVISYWTTRPSILYNGAGSRGDSSTASGPPFGGTPTATNPSTFTYGGGGRGMNLTGTTAGTVTTGADGMDGLVVIYY